MEVGGREAQQPESRVDQRVLSAVVFDEPVAMVRAVELDDQARDRVVQVGAADKPAAGIVEVFLHVGSRQSGLEEKPAESGLHRRLCRFRELIEPAETEAQCLIGKDQALDCGKSPP
jgi:hypothetical protein